MGELDASFFEQSPVDCARGLIGAVFRWDGCEARIVETEAYAAEGDPACHTFSRPSARLFTENHDAGTAYVYLNYGVHWLFNVLVKGAEGAGFVLFRALEPISGIELMRDRRPGHPDQSLASGPGRLTKALGIDGNIHGTSFLGSKIRGIQASEHAEILVGTRIGISRAADFMWRFGDPKSDHLSRPFR